jgi:DNA-binding transcriptional ArsR family regulator
MSYTLSTLLALFNQLVDNLTEPLYGSATRWLNTEAQVAGDELSRIFAALADPTRRDMVARLAVHDATVNELAAPYDVSVQAISKHLRVLEGAGLVSRSKDAQRRPVHLEAEVFDLMTKWIERYRREAEDRFRRLDAVLEQMEPKTNRRGAAS